MGSRKLAGHRNECRGGCGRCCNSVWAFTAHRVGSYREGTRRCMTGDEFAQTGFMMNSAGFYITGGNQHRPGSGTAVTRG